MAIDREQVEHIALLARLKLKEDELEKFTQQLDEILEYVHKLDELDTSNVEPMYHAIDHANIWRKDEVQPSLPPDEALANAPDRHESFFRVPKVTE